MARTSFVDMIVMVVSALFRVWLAVLPDDQRLRLNGVEQVIDDVLQRVRIGLWNTTIVYWQDLAEQRAGRCPDCDHACERSLAVTSVLVDGFTLAVPTGYYYCRTCKRGRTPVAQWLGLQRGLTSAGVERHVAALSTRVSFHEAGEQMHEQHGQTIDVGKVERMTYGVARDAETFLQDRHESAVQNLERKPARKGVESLIVTTDGGGAPVGELHRPAREQAKKFTPVRKLPVGMRAQTHREMRVILVHPPQQHGEQRWVDVHLSVPDHPEVSGERMRALAAMAGLGEQTRVHGVFDMGTWIRPQFVQTFGVYHFTICADQMHVLEYLGEGAKALWPGSDQEGERKDWLDQQRGQLRGGRWRTVRDALGDGEQKAVVDARRYLDNHHQDMNYGQLHAQGWPVASGEAEGAVRHQIRNRLDNAGVWREDHLPWMGALLSVRESGLWDEFWAWREERDVNAFRERQKEEYRRRFRGERKRKAQDPPEEQRSSA
jgi:hypothetical protein